MGPSLNSDGTGACCRVDMVVRGLGHEFIEATLQVAQGSTMAFELGAKVDS